MSLAEPREPERIADIPKIRELLRQTEALLVFKKALPFLKPIMWLLRIDGSQIEMSLHNAEQLHADIEELRTLPDAFNDLLADRGWIIYDHLSLEAVKKAVALARVNGLEAAEAHLVEYFSDEEIGRQLRRMQGVKAFRSRMRLALLALEDHKAQRFHASIPVVLALTDGLVSEISENQRGLFAEGVDLRAWDSISAHDKGLNTLARILQKTRRKTTTEPIELPYRHGILHGRDLGYDNRLVATKAWAALFAVRDWAGLAEGKQLDAPTPSPSPGLRETLQRWQGLQEQKKQLAAWRPRIVTVGKDVPRHGSPDDYPEGSPERHIVTFLLAWTRGNYGHMARDAGTPWKGTSAPSPAEMRATFHDKPLVRFELVSIEDQAAAVSLVTVKRYFDAQASQADDAATYRLIRVNCDGDMVVAAAPGHRWAIINWNW